jgi:hypothetical protein
MSRIVEDAKALKVGQHHLQLVPALVGGYVQCPHCYKYFSCAKLCKRHTNPTPACSKDGFEWKYKFAQCTDNKFFCYFGCDTFRGITTLERHLVERHETDLQFWGISALHLKSRVQGRLQGDSGKSNDETQTQQEFNTSLSVDFSV